MKILLIDDDRIFITGVQRNLYSYGHIVESASTVSEIESAVDKSERYDLIVIDLMMRKIKKFEMKGEKFTGIEIVKFLMSKKTKAKLVVLTGVDSGKIEFDFKGNGVYFLSKPLTTGSRELIQVIKTL